ncbi:hypothetical protein DSO57_1000355 [Entomophthora muscae]|uniref:Uncharacterized protein n=1 Tax=Entomophthora muscae TaxID=34485 RepID=A0ACC2TKR0_9FUNG|nr:hypothetical protein DSO57_1000355 [Entomophthora muscae]
MVELNTFVGRGLFELPIGICAYVFPTFFPIIGLDKENPATIFLLKAFGASSITISVLSIYAGMYEGNIILRRQVAVALMGYSSMMVTLLMSISGLIDLHLIKQIPPEVFLIIVHGMFTAEFYSFINSGQPSTATPGVSIE